MVIVAGPQLFQVCHWWRKLLRRTEAGAGATREATAPRPAAATCAACAPAGGAGTAPAGCGVGCGWGVGCAGAVACAGAWVSPCVWAVACAGAWAAPEPGLERGERRRRGRRHVLRPGGLPGQGQLVDVGHHPPRAGHPHAHRRQHRHQSQHPQHRQRQQRDQHQGRGRHPAPPAARPAPGAARRAGRPCGRGGRTGTASYVRSSSDCAPGGPHASHQEHQRIVAASPSGVPPDGVRSRRPQAPRSATRTKASTSSMALGREAKTVAAGLVLPITRYSATS